MNCGLIDGTRASINLLSVLAMGFMSAFFILLTLRLVSRIWILSLLDFTYWMFISSNLKAVLEVSNKRQIVSTSTTGKDGGYWWLEYALNCWLYVSNHEITAYLSAIRVRANGVPIFDRRPGTRPG